MTIIAARIKNGKITLAGDEQTSWGDYMKYPKKKVMDKSVKESGKIFQINGMTIGAAGSCAHSGLLQIFCKTHHPKEMTRDAILDWVIEFKEWCLEKAKINFNDISVCGIIIMKRKAFTFYDHLEIYPITKFDAVGSGMNLAIGAMELGATAEEAVSVAIKYDPHCSGRITKIEL